MLKLTKTFSFEVDGVKFEALKPTRRDLLEKGKNAMDLVAEKILKIEGLLSDDGSEVTAESYKALPIPLDFEQKIAAAYMQTYTKMMGDELSSAEAAEKKDKATDLPSS